MRSTTHEESLDGRCFVKSVASEWESQKKFLFAGIVYLSDAGWFRCLNALSYLLVL